MRTKRAACVLANTPYTGALADRAVGDTGYDDKTSYGSPGWCFKDSGYCAEDEHFIVWMRAAGLPNFRKLYGKIETRLEPGTYTINVTNGYDDDGDGTYVNGAGVEQRFLYPVSSFGGTKAIVLSTTSWLGGRNFFLGYAYVIVGVVSIVLSVCFAIKHHMNPRELGHELHLLAAGEDVDSVRVGDLCACAVSSATRTVESALRARERERILFFVTTIRPHARARTARHTIHTRLAPPPHL